MSDGGTYTLLIERAAGGALTVGALGEIEFPAGWYAYTGSALGPGGFSRIDRHERVAAGEHDARHWHVDYLLGDPDSRLDDVVRSPGADVECAVARAVDGDATPEFGCSDCDCDSHLAYREDHAALVDAVERAHREADRREASERASGSER
ncbi:GIY-YIG nuclease family protein [Halomicrobium salinisoli]|uniref:GIY-YIG nuclease family protein n=1 Tax=Halomicrobium salinisoli TaxID=2878391 RepID=UPI001CF01F1A|nr:GIY-YIG nuclease family protein [Halomicrobium salinisoli]